MTMKKLALSLGVVFVGLGVVILVLAEGLRRWYSGIFFVLIGIVALSNALVRREVPDG
jgi:hypothetical protein